MAAQVGGGGHEFRLLERRERFAGPVFRVVSDRVSMPHGGSATRDVVLHLGVVAVVARNSLGRIALVKQYRHPVGERLWELPAGLLDNPGEQPEAAARRELLEETGLVADHMEKVLDIHTSPGFSDETVHLFFANVVHELTASQPREALCDEEADMTWSWIAPERCVSMIMRGEITNAICQIGLLIAASQPGLASGR